MKKTSIFAIILCLLATPALAKKEKDHHQKSLPPGLAKKVENGGRLPPGWQKKLEVGQPIDIDIYQFKRVVVPLDNKGLITVEIDGKIVRLYEATREIVEILN